MKETKDQTIERLKKEVAEQKSELTKVKKDRKRLNYAVEKMKRQMQKLSSQSSIEDIEKIKELEQLIEEQKSTIAEKENEMAQKELYYEGSYNLLKSVTEQLRKQKIADAVEYEERIITKFLRKLLDWQYGRESNYEQLDRFRNGDRYFDYTFKDYPDMHIRFAIFSVEDLFIRIHPKNGRTLTDIDLLYLKMDFQNRCEYLFAQKEYDDYKKCNPNATNDELVEWVYQKGKQLLPKYEKMIF